MRHAWLAALALAFMPTMAFAGHHGGFRIGVGIGFGGYGYPGYGCGYYGGYCGPRYYTPAYYPPAVVYSPPVIVESAPVVVSPPPVVYERTVVVDPPVSGYYYNGERVYRETRYYYGR